jgi:hypothetical protein
LPEKEVRSVKAKKPLLLIAFLAILLVLLIVMPTVAFAAPGGSGGGKPVNWASFVCDSNNDFPDFPTMDAIHVQQLPDGTVRGKYLDQFTGKPGGESDYRWSSKNFTSVYWDALLSPLSLSHAWFGPAADYPADRWPTGGGLPSDWEDLVGNANIADFVVYVPLDQVPQLWLDWGLLPPDADSLPVRYVLLDFGEGSLAGRDLYEAWICVWGSWVTENDVLIPVPNGNIQVHVGAPDF